MSLSKKSKWKPSGKRLILGAVSFILLASLAFAVSYSFASTGKPAEKPAVGTRDNPHQVALKKENEDPIDVLIKQDDYVQFSSKDGGQHQIVQGKHGNTEHSESLLDSGVFNSDEGYLLQFKEGGKFEFHDNYDHDYTITIIAYNPNAKTEDSKIR